MNTSPNFAEQEHLKCPRCDSNNTKFCYYNNYNLSQPRHYCKNCRRYWTKGGTLRNIPIGGATRKNTKRSSNSIKRTTNSSYSNSPAAVVMEPPPAVQNLSGASGIYGYGNAGDSGGGGGGSFSSLLASTPGGQFAKLLMDGLNPNLINGSNEDHLIRNRNPNLEEFESNFLSVNRKTNDQSVSEGDDAWPDLSIYTPGSSFH